MNSFHLAYIFVILGTIVNLLIYRTIYHFGMKYQKLLRDVKKLILIDPLTGLYNRRYNVKTSVSLLLILFDIDRFKKLNEQNSLKDKEFLIFIEII